MDLALSALKALFIYETIVLFCFISFINFWPKQEEIGPASYSASIAIEL